jgi:probable rRNA maturation factor
VIRVSVVDAAGRAVRAPGLARWHARVAPARAAGQVTVALVSDARMRALNSRYRMKNYPTDVLAFGPPSLPRRAHDRHLGDIVIAKGVAARQARGFGHPLPTELKILALHGLLHLLGYDHETDTGQMAELERRLRRKGGLNRGLTERSHHT